MLVHSFIKYTFDKYNLSTHVTRLDKLKSIWVLFQDLLFEFMAVAFIIAVVTVNCLQHFHGDDFTFTDDCIFDENFDSCQICFLYLFCWFRGLQLKKIESN